MNRRTLITRALAALATLPLFGKAVAAEAEAAEQGCLVCGCNHEAAMNTRAHGYEVAYEGGSNFARWWCGTCYKAMMKAEAAPDPGVWGFVTDYYPDSDMLDYTTTRYEWVPRSAFQ